MKNIYRNLVVVGIVAISNNAYSNNQVKNTDINQVSRYVTLEPKPTVAQKNPLLGVIPKISFGNNIKTVGQAIQAVLKDSGYRLARYHPEKRVLKLLSMKLPNIHKNMGPITLWETLEVLAGEPWKLSVDPISRLVSFELPLDYQSPEEIKKNKEFAAYKLLIEESYQKELMSSIKSKRKAK